GARARPERRRERPDGGALSEILAGPSDDVADLQFLLALHAHFSRGLSALLSLSASDPNPSAGAASARSAYSRTSSASRASTIALTLRRMRRPGGASTSRTT